MLLNDNTVVKYHIMSNATKGLSMIRSKKSKEMEEIARLSKRLYLTLNDKGKLLDSLAERPDSYWSLLSALSESGPLTVPRIADNLSLSRQRVQVMVNRSIELGAVTLKENKEHKKSKLVALTLKGKKELLIASYQIWKNVEQIAKQFNLAELKETSSTLSKMCDALDNHDVEPN